MIEFRDQTVYRGPNIWARMPSLRFTVDIGELEERPTNKIPGFYERLTELIPSLYDHRCSLGKPGGFLQRMREGTWMGHVLEHVALEIQNLAGAEVVRGKTRSTKEKGVYNVVFEYEQEDVGIAAAELARRLAEPPDLRHRARFRFPEVNWNEPFIRTAERLAYGPSTGSIVSEAERRNIPVIRLDPRRSLVQLGHGVHQKRIWATVTSETSNIAVDTASNKELTSKLLHEVGIPVPRGYTVRNVDDAVREARRIRYPVVIKPLDGNHGRGVCINLKDEAEVREFFPVALNESRAGIVVVESFIEGLGLSHPGRQQPGGCSGRARSRPCCRRWRAHRSSN